MLYGRRISLKLKSSVYGSYVLVVLYGSVALCLKKSGMGFLHRAMCSIVRAMFGYSSKIEKRSTDLMLMLCWSKTIDQLAIASSVLWYGYVLRREDCHVL